MRILSGPERSLLPWEGENRRQPRESRQRGFQIADFKLQKYERRPATGLSI